jgi:hypothetical protein
MKTLDQLARLYTAAFMALMLCLVIGCGYQPKTDYGKAVAAWWGKDSTQKVVMTAQQAATQFAGNAALATLQAWAGGGKMDVGAIATQAGINTLWMQASNIRQLQGTTQVLDPIATARLLQQGGTPEELARSLAQQLFDNASALIQLGIPPDQAVEINAAGIDAKALLLTQKQALP